MQQFVVPQFIEVEDRIFGPITTRQFIILLIAGIVCFLAFRYADLSLFIFTLIIIGGGGLLFAFVKVNGQQFHFFLLNIIQTLRKPSLRIWYKHYSDKDLEFLRNYVYEVPEIEEPSKRPVSRSRIRDLSLVVNTGGFYEPDDAV